jgi:hypothetical protein
MPDPFDEETFAGDRRARRVAKIGTGTKHAGTRSA